MGLVGCKPSWKTKAPGSARDPASKEQDMIKNIYNILFQSPHVCAHTHTIPTSTDTLIFIHIHTKKEKKCIVILKTSTVLKGTLSQQ